jgi:hypothetical protein
MGLQVNLMLPWRKIGEPQRGDGAFSNTPPVKRPRGRQECYSDKLFVKALIVMIIRRLYTAYALLSFLEQADPVAQQMRPLLTGARAFSPTAHLGTAL